MTPTQIHFAAAAMLLMLAAPLNASAHLMVEQRGTINIVDDSAFMVVSVPVAAFPVAPQQSEKSRSWLGVALTPKC